MIASGIELAAAFHRLDQAGSPFVRVVAGDLAIDSSPEQHRSMFRCMAD
jgi:hypothetical protein